MMDLKSSRKSNIKDKMTKLAKLQVTATAVVSKDLETCIKTTIKSNNAKGPALKPSTIQRKGHDTKLLDTGKLEASVHTKTGAQGTTVGVHKNEERAKVAIIHEFGAPDAGIPQRSFVRSTWLKNRARLITTAREIVKKGL